MSALKPPWRPPLEIIDVDRTWATATEHLGTKRKYWFIHSDGSGMLFKAEERGTGEDWAEVASGILARLLGLPHVYYALALETAEAVRGVICNNCAPPPWSLVHGNQLLQRTVAGYPRDAAKYQVHAHTVHAVCAVLGDLELPPVEWCHHLPKGITSALGVFIGYVMLDAWIANQDRHHENWGALVKDGVAHLAPTFDHGAAMARNLSDDERRQRLNTKDKRQSISAFARKARSAFYTDATTPKPLKTLAAWQEFANRSPSEAQIWITALNGVDKAMVMRCLDLLPEARMSSISKQFTLELLLENQRRILDGDST